MFAFKPPFMPGRTGYRVAYHEAETNHCPSCGRSHWLVGRMTAECAYCATALPLSLSMTGANTSRRPLSKLAA